MRLHRPVLVALALGTVLPVSAASAATGVAAAGSAVSSATLASLSIGDLTVAGTTLSGHDVSVATLSAVAQTLSQDAPAVSFVPITLDGVKKGEVTVTPATSPKSVGAVATGALPLNVLSASSPSATLTATKAATGPVSGLTASLGELSVLGMPLNLDGGVKVGSATDAAKAQAGKTLTITDVSLPNLSDLLAALGIDVKKLPVGTLSGLIDSLELQISGAAQTAIDAAEGAIGTADGVVGTTLTTYQGAVTTLSTETAELDAELATAILPATPELPAPLTAPLDHADWDALNGATGDAFKTAFEAANVADTGLIAAIAAYEAAKDEAKKAKDAYDAAVAAIQPLVDKLAELVDGVLATNPLLTIDAAQIGTNALAGSSKAATVSGYVSGVKVLGTDVLQTVTGNTKLDVAGLTNTIASQVNAALATATGALSSVLATAPGLVVPAPSVKVLTKQTSTGMDGAFAIANVLVTALSVDIASVTVPDAFAIAGADQLAGILPTSTGFKTAPMSVKVGQLGEAARFRPAGSIGSNPGSHPATGAPYGLAAIALIGTALAFGIRRMARSES